MCLHPDVIDALAAAGATGPMIAAASSVRQPHDLSPRIRRLRDGYFRGVQRGWNNQFTCWTTGTPWDMASSRGTPKPSCAESITSTSAAAYCADSSESLSRETKLTAPVRPRAAAYRWSARA